MGLQDYIDKPVPGQALNDPAKYADLVNTLRIEFANNANALQIISNVVQIVNQVVSQFTGVAPLAVSRALFAGDIAGALQLLQPHTDGSATVTDPVTGSACPLTDAFNNIVGGLGVDLRSKIGSVIAGFLAK